MHARISSPLAVLLAFAFGAIGADAQTITLKFRHFLGPTSFFQLDVVEPWARAKRHAGVYVELLLLVAPSIRARCGRALRPTSTRTTSFALFVINHERNPLQGFNDHMKTHTDTQFYTSAFFIVMNRAKSDSLPADVKAALDSMSGDAWSAKFGPLWDKWDKPVRDGASRSRPRGDRADAATMAQWREGLRPVTENYLAELSKTFPNASRRTRS